MIKKITFFIIGVVILCLYVLYLIIATISYEIWKIRGEPCFNCGFKLKNVKLSMSAEGYHKHCPNCGAITYIC